MPDPMSPGTPATPAPPKHEEEESKRPEDTPFKQQRLPAWQPVMSPKYVIGCLIFLSVVFVSIGAAVIVTSDKVIEVEARYDQFPVCSIAERKAPGYACPPITLDIRITKTMKAPVFAYYRLENFYQNHRRYAKSRSDTQLAGDVPSSENLGDCHPFRSPGQFQSLGDNASDRLISVRVGQPKVDAGSLTYSPCGLVAWSMFNDSFLLEQKATARVICDGTAFDAAGNPLPDRENHCEKRGIAWPSDPGVRFAAPKMGNDIMTHLGFNASCPFGEEPRTNAERYACNGWYFNEEGHKIPDPTDEDLMVWVRLASMSTFRKLYRRITTDIEPGTYQLTIFQRFDVSSFDGKKKFVLSTSSWIGGKNYFLGGLYVAVGILCFIIAIGFLIKDCSTPQRVTSI